MHLRSGSKHFTLFEEGNLDNGHACEQMCKKHITKEGVPLYLYKWDVGALVYDTLPSFSCICITLTMDNINEVSLGFYPNIV